MLDQSSSHSPTTDPARPIGPATPKERIEVIDILRGFALFGVLLINMRNFDLPGQVWTGTADRITLWLILVLGDSKFWALFSFLFGLGFALQMQRAESRDAHFVPFYTRRLCVLLLFGMLHFLIYPFDILYDYAVTGFLLLLIRNRSTKEIVTVALICLAIPIGYHAAEVCLSELRRSNPETVQAAAQRQAEERRGDEEATRYLTKATFTEVVVFNARHIVSWTFRLDRYFWRPGGPGGLLGGPFPLFLLGLLAGRYRVFHRMREHLPFIRKALPWTLAFGLVSSVVSVTGNWPDPVLPYDARAWRGLLWYFATPALSFSYACVVMVLCHKDHWKARLTPLAAMGRTALSNYLLQSLIFTTIFLHYGLGLAGKIGPLAVAFLTLVIYSLQLLLSVWWLRRFRFGPAEWLWRSLTYGKLQPMRAAPRQALQAESGS